MSTPIMADIESDVVLLPRKKEYLNGSAFRLDATPVCVCLLDSVWSFSEWRETPDVT
jgi:hypothetical protein